MSATRKRVRPFGAWPSSLAPSALSAGRRRLADLRVDGDTIGWVEGRPAEGGRSVLVLRSPDGSLVEPAPPDWSVRSTAHEYGGGAWTPTPVGPVISRQADQALWLLGEDGPLRLTPTPPPGRRWRHADGVVTPDGRRIVCVREVLSDDHTGHDEIVSVGLDGGDAGDGASPQVLASGHDFCTSPRVSPDGQRLAFVTWDAPRMPWDGSDLWVVDLGAEGTPGPPTHVAGGPDESISDPDLDAAGALWWVSDRSGWWNLVRDGVTVAGGEVEHALAHWIFGRPLHARLPGGGRAVAWIDRGVGHLGVLGPDGRREIETPLADVDCVRTTAKGTIVVLGAGPRQPACVAEVDPASGAFTVLRSSVDVTPEPGDISMPEALELASHGGRRTHAFFYPPASATTRGPDDERPPLVVMSHGGPTSATTPAWSEQVAFWTTRGFAVVDVNYGGSTGFGRAYRRLLAGAWGVVDVEDCRAAARHLGAIGRVDPARVVIRGGSAGGFTTLAALVADGGAGDRRDGGAEDGGATDGQEAFAAAPVIFAAGASLYGVADLALLASDTHRFEARYLDGLVGPWPQAAGLYRQRSPIHHVDQLRTPMIVLQGTEDPVVPRNQADAVVAALDEHEVPHAYLLFEGEGHGFRSGEAIERAIGGEYAFYCAVLGIEAPPGTAEVTIAHRERLARR